MEPKRQFSESRRNFKKMRYLMAGQVPKARLNPTRFPQKLSQNWKLILRHFLRLPVYASMSPLTTSMTTSCRRRHFQIIASRQNVKKLTRSRTRHLILSKGQTSWTSESYGRRGAILINYSFDRATAVAELSKRKTTS